MTGGQGDRASVSLALPLTLLLIIHFMTRVVLCPGVMPCVARSLWAFRGMLKGLSVEFLNFTGGPG